MRMMIVAAVALLACAGAHADEPYALRPLDGGGGLGELCSNLLHRWPTDAPMEVEVEGKRMIVVCQAWSTMHPIRLTFAAESDLAWWYDHTEDRTIVEGEGPSD